MRRKGPEASLDPVLSSTFMDRFLAAVFTTRRGSTCRDVALRNFGTGCITLDCHSSHLSSTSAMLNDLDRQSPHLVSLIDGSCEVHQEQQNCFSETSPALVWLRHLETEYLTLHGRGSSFGFHCFPTFQPLSFFSLRLILCISGLEAVFCSIGRFAKSPPVLNSI